MKRKRLFAAISAAALCISMMGNVPMVSVAQGRVEVETETATGSDAGFGTVVEADEDFEAPAFVDESEVTTREEADEEIIEDEEPRLTVTAGDWEYSDNDDGTITITRYTGRDTEVVVPEQIDGKKVTSIGKEAFFNRIKLTSIKIPAGVTIIGVHAFWQCESLTNIEIPEGVTIIGDHAFAGCGSLTSIEIPEGVTSIGEGAFMNCWSLESIKIPEGVTSIENVTFYNCDNLADIELPTSLTSIGSYAFYECVSLTSIEIPSGVTSIGEAAFWQCESLTNIEIPSGVTSIGKYTFYNCSNLTSIIKIPSGVTSIENCAFYGCSNLTSIEIPSEVTVIGARAFAWCDNLTIYCIADSIAETYAKENNIPFVSLCEESDLSKVTVVTDSVTYNGSYQTAKLYIMYKNNKIPLVEGIHYTDTVKSREAGTTTVKITGKGYYTGETTVSFTVNPLHLKNALEAGDVTLTATDLEYTGRLQQSTVKVTYNGKTLTEGTDYTLKGNGRKAVGTSWAVVTGTGNYTGTIKIKYAMKKATQSNMMVYTKDKRAVDVRTQGATIQLTTSRVRDGAKIVYSVEKPNQGITVSQDGKVTVKKGTKPGKYRIKVLAESTPYYKATSKYFTVVVK